MTEPQIALNKALMEVDMEGVSIKLVGRDKERRQLIDVQRIGQLLVTSVLCERVSNS